MKRRYEKGKEGEKYGRKEKMNINLFRAVYGGRENYSIMIEKRVKERKG